MANPQSKTGLSYPISTSTTPGDTCASSPSSTHRLCIVCIVSASRASPPGGLLVCNVVPTTQNHFKSVRNLTPINPPMHPTTHTPTNTLEYLCKWYMLKRNWIIFMCWICISYLVIWHNFTHQSTQPPILPPICNGVLANYKCSNKFELCSFC